MPQVTDAGSEPQVYIQWKSRNYSNTKSRTSTTKIKSLETKWRKFSNKTPTCQTKLPKNTKRHQKSSRKTQLWLWSRGRSPPICSLSTAAMEKLIPKQTISPHGENHFSKKRSESKSYSQYKRLNSKSGSKSENRSESYSRYERINLKSENKSENKDIKDVKVRNEEKITKTKAKMTAKVDEVKAIEKTLTEFTMEKVKQLDKKIGSESPVTLPLHFATTFNISIFDLHPHNIYYFILNNFISISNSSVLDPLDHHFQTFTIEDLSDCKMLCLSQKTASVQAKTSVKAFANPDSI
jgi:hypothetical protein